MAERILSNEEIAEMEKLTVDRLVESIDRGDREGAKKLARRMYNEFLSMHDLYRNWTAATLSFVGRHFGDKALEEAMDEGVKAWWGPRSGAESGMAFQVLFNSEGLLETYQRLVPRSCTTSRSWSS